MLFTADFTGHQERCFDGFPKCDDFQNYQKEIGNNKAVGGGGDGQVSRAS